MTGQDLQRHLARRAIRLSFEGMLERTKGFSKQRLESSKGL